MLELLFVEALQPIKVALEIVLEIEGGDDLPLKLLYIRTKERLEDFRSPDSHLQEEQKLRPSFIRD